MACTVGVCKQVLSQKGKPNNMLQLPKKWKQKEYVAFLRWQADFVGA